MIKKKCGKCGTSERYASGECKFCRNERKKAYRARVSGKSTDKNPVKRKPVKQKTTKTQPVDLSSSLSTGPNRLRFMIERHERTLQSIDDEEARLAQRLEEAEQSNRLTDIRFYTSERRKLLEMRVGYDARLAKDLQAYQELVAKEDNETPIELIIEAPDMTDFIRPSLGDGMDIDNLLPEAANK